MKQDPSTVEIIATIAVMGIFMLPWVLEDLLSGIERIVRAWRKP